MYNFNSNAGLHLKSEDKQTLKPGSLFAGTWESERIRFANLN